jgi:hypothetical protein
MLLPFAVISSTLITTRTSSAYAATLSNPTNLKTHIHSTVEIAKEAPGALSQIGELLTTIHEWWNNLPHDIAQGSVNLMAWLYELCSDLILKTPLWIFDNEWFENTTYMFSLASIGIVTVLTVLEGIKRMIPMFNKKSKKVQPMDLKTIMKRWFIISGISTAMPYIFQKGFQLLNKVSDMISGMGAKTLTNVALPASISTFEVVTLVLFDVVLISTIVPILWKNGRRFFDLMMLGLISPLALTAFIFDNYKSYYTQWLDNVKHLSLVQVYYSLFLLVLGWMIFGLPTPSTFTGLILKLLVTIGGFNRLSNPPKFVSKHLDNGGGFNEIYDPAKDTVSKTVRNFKDTVSIIRKPTTIVKKVHERLQTPERVGKTRMQRFHTEAPKASPKPRKRK